MRVLEHQALVQPGCGEVDLASQLKEVILLVHGIRTFAGWQPMVKRILEEIPDTKVIPIKYGYLDAFRFWCPFITRRAAIDELRREIQHARAAYPDAQISAIAHSFGTYAIARILTENPDIKFHRLILSGAIIPRTYRWDYVRDRLATDVVNDYGTRDIWPVLAKCLSWGYGDTGRHGFGRTGVVDRGHNYAHSDFFNEKFVRDYWKPWFEHSKIVSSPWEEEAPPSSWPLSILSVIPLQWALCLLLLAAAVGLGMSAAFSTPPSTRTDEDPQHLQSTIPKDSEQQQLHYYLKKLPAVQAAGEAQIIAEALRSWKQVADVGGGKVSREADANAVLELGPLPFVTVKRPDDPGGTWRILFSSQEQYDAARLEAAACHAFGRFFGLGYSKHPADVMFDYDNDPTAQRALKPSPHDIREIQKRSSR